MTNKKIGFYFESSLPVIPSNDDFAFYYIKNEQQINGENKNIPDVYLYNKSLNQYFQINKPHNLDLRTINSLPILDNNIDLGLNDILNFNNETDIPLNLNGNLLYSKLNSLFFTNRNIPTDENVLNSIIFGTNFGNQEVIVKSNNDIYFGNNINISNPSMSNIVIGNDIELQNQTIDFNNNIFIGGSYDFETESIYYGKIATPAVPKIENNIFIKNLGFGNTQHFFKFVAPLVLSDNTKIIDNDNNNENDSLLYDNILVAKNNGLIGIKRINSFDFMPTLSQVLTKSGNSNTINVENINVENINVENLKFNNYENNESISLDNKIGYLIIDNTGKILWKQLENKPTLESVILENPNANTKPIFNEVEITNKLYVKNLSNKNNDILFDKIIITDSNGELAQISKNDLLSEKQNVLGYNPENSENKSLNILADKTSSTKYPSVKALYDYVQPEFNSRLNGYAYDSVSEFPIGIQTDAFFIDRETGSVYIGWTDPNYSGDPALGDTYYKNLSLKLGETASTAFRGDFGQIAYTHSQATGNPHNTKVEELTDVGSETTSIIDTDVILKKEVVGGLWRKITWENIKASLKTYFDDLYAPKAFNVKVTTPSSWVTGTTSETEVLRIEIPANSISDNSFLNMPILMINKLGTNGTIQIRGKLSTSPTMPSGTDHLFQTAIVGATNQYVGLDRIFLINSGAIKGFPSGNTSYASNTPTSNPILSKPFNRTVTNYLYISITLGNSADQARLEGIQLTNS